LCCGFIIRCQIGFDLGWVVKGVRQSIVDVGRAQVRILGHDFFDCHAPPMASQDHTDTNSSACNDGTPATAVGDMLNITEISLGHKKRLAQAAVASSCHL